MGILWPLLVVAAALLAGVRAAFWAVTIKGHSMEPALHDGDLLIAARWWSGSWLQRGGLVLIKGYGGRDASRTSMMVKRIAYLAGDVVEFGSTAGMRDLGHADAEVRRKRALAPGEIYVTSDNPLGIDSRVWGPISIAAVAGIGLWRVGLPGRTPVSAEATLSCEPRIPRS